MMTITYKEKIDNLLAQNAVNQSVLQKLTDTVNAQTVQITELKVQMTYMNQIAATTKNLHKNQN